MKLVVPVSQSDIHLAQGFCNAVEACPNKEKYDVLVVAAPSVEDEAEGLAHRLQVFGNVNMFVLDMDPIGGWPKAPNKHFLKTAQYLALNKHTAPWLWCELDATPMVPGWFDALWEAYRLGGKPFMGTLNDTHYVKTDGSVFSQGQHMVGVGVYPADLWARSTLLRFTTDQPFDVWLQHEIVPHCHGTDLIQHAWSTCNFRKEGESIVCDDVEPLKFGISHKCRVSNQAVLFHGCKDGSLARLVTGEPDNGPLMIPLKNTKSRRTVTV